MACPLGDTSEATSIPSGPCTPKPASPQHDQHHEGALGQRLTDPIDPPLQSQKAPKSPSPPLSPPAQPRRLIVVRLWVGFSCPRAVIVLIRSTYFDEGFTRKKKRRKAGGDNRIADDIPITQPLRTASAAAESENYA